MPSLWDENDQWYPASVSHLESALSSFLNSSLGIPRVGKIRKNIAYNLQFLEYLHQTITTLQLSSVLVTQSYKMYVITAGGIIEALLYCSIKSNGYQSTSDQKEIRKNCSSVTIAGKPITIESVFYEKITTFDTEMSFDSIIKKAEAKKLLGGNQTLYNDLHKLRKLRNKVHLHAMEDSATVFDTDWHSFRLSEYKLTRDTLRETLIVLLGGNISSDTRLSFLNS